MVHNTIALPSTIFSIIRDAHLVLPVLDYLVSFYISPPSYVVERVASDIIVISDSSREETLRSVKDLRSQARAELLGTTAAISMWDRVLDHKILTPIQQPRFETSIKVRINSGFRVRDGISQVFIPRYNRTIASSSQIINSSELTVDYGVRCAHRVPNLMKLNYRGDPRCSEFIRNVGSKANACTQTELVKSIGVDVGVQVGRSVPVKSFSEAVCSLDYNSRFSSSSKRSNPLDSFKIYERILRGDKNFRGRLMLDRRDTSLSMTRSCTKLTEFHSSCSSPLRSNSGGELHSCSGHRSLRTNSCPNFGD